MEALMHRLDDAITQTRASVAAIEELARGMEGRVTRLEGSTTHLGSVLKGCLERLTAMEVLQTGSEEGSFAWALTMWRYGNAMRRGKWQDATRVECFEWHQYLDTAPDEDILATDWRKA